VVEAEKSHREKHREKEITVRPEVEGGIKPRGGKV